MGLVILAIVAFGGTTGFFLYKDAKNLQAQAGTLMSEVSSMKDYLKNGEGEQLNATAGTVAERVASMRDTVNGPAWTIASFLSVYGDDIKLVRGVMEQADILAQDAMLPACAQLEDFKPGNLLTDGAVNIEMLKGLITTIQDVEPVVVSSIDAIDALPSRILASPKASWTRSPVLWTPPRRSSPTSTDRPRPPSDAWRWWRSYVPPHGPENPSCTPRRSARTHRPASF